MPARSRLHQHTGPKRQGGARLAQRLGRAFPRRPYGGPFRPCRHDGAPPSRRAAKQE